MNAFYVLTEIPSTAVSTGPTSQSSTQSDVTSIGKLSTTSMPTSVETTVTGTHLPSHSSLLGLLYQNLTIINVLHTMCCIGL